MGCKNFRQVSTEPLMKKLHGFMKVGLSLISVTTPSRSFTMHLASPTIKRTSLEKNQLAILNSGSLLIASRTRVVPLGSKKLRLMSAPPAGRHGRELYCLKKI